MESPKSVEVFAYPLGWRIVAAALFAAAGASLPVILLEVLLATDPPITPPVLARLVVVLCVLPTLAARLVRRAFAAQVSVESEHLVLARSGLRIEIPARSIAGIVPWSLPLPGVGMWLRLESGRRFARGLETSDPQAVIGLLADAAAPAAAGPARHHPTFVYATAKRATGARRWYHYAAKFGVFSLLPAAILFNAHQHIAYGGTLGQYYLEGPGPYLTTWAVYWSTVVVYLVLYAAPWRGAAEAAALFAAWVAPARAVRVRRLAEAVCRIAFYGGVPLLLLIRFLP